MSFIFAMSRWLYFSALLESEFYSFPMLANWYEFLSLAAMFRIAVPFAGTLRLAGIDTNSMGLYVRGGLAFLSSPAIYKGPHITADCFAKVKSISNSWGPLFLKGILNF